MLSGASTPGQSGPVSNDNETVLSIHLNSRIEASLSDCLVAYPGHFFLWVESYPSIEMQSVYFTDPSDWAINQKRSSRMI